MKNNLIIAGYNNSNLGDDLMFATLVNNSSYDNYYFYGPELKPAFLQKTYRFIKYSRALILLLRWKFRADFALVGGSLFMGENDIQLSMFNWKINLLRINKLFGGNNLVLGSNLGPYRDYSEYATSLKKVIKLVDFWKVRDQFSYDLLLNLGADNVEFIPDIVMGFDFIKYQNRTIKKTIAISVTNVDKDGSTKGRQSLFEKEIIAMIESYHLKGYLVELLSFEDSKDVAVMERIKKSVKSNGEIVLIKNYNDDVLKSISQADIVVSTRFHCMVISAILKKKQIIYQYSDKTANFAERYGFKVYKISGDTSHKDPISTEFPEKDIEYAGNMFKNMREL